MKKYDCKAIMINGRVCYEDGHPFNIGRVLLYAYIPYKGHEDKIKFHKKYCASTTIDNKGSFSFLIYDARFYYKIKVYANAYINKNSINCCINLVECIGVD